MKIKVLFVVLTMLCVPSLHASENSQYEVGLAKVDITPDYPIRLNGFGNRREESAGVSQQVFARAMAISQGETAPLVVIAVDNLGIRLSQADEVARRLAQSHNLPREGLAITFSHTHCAPKVNGASDNIFSSPIPPAHQKHIDRYTKEIVDLMTKAARQALDARKPSTLHWSVGEATFAKNRRTPGGPVDHDLPTLIVRNADDGAIRGVYVSYACHAVTLRFNKISGDWAGYAAELIERKHPGAVALVSIGAGSDQNPTAVTPDDVQIAERQGAEIATEVARLARGEMRPIQGEPYAQLTRIKLPLSQVPTRQQLADVAENGGRPTDRYNAKTQLARLDRGEKLLTHIDYPIQTWSFGDSFSMTFLGGEVCVDYSLRLKSEIDRERFWLNAYSNDFCSYIPSERLVKEGGYGGGAEVPYFALPATLAPGLEQKIVDEVKRQTPPDLIVPSGVNGIMPKSPEASRQCMETHDELEIQLAAAEPVVRDPVAIDFAPDGSAWVAEMSDYGRGVYEPFKPTGRIRRLRDRDGDGHYETATTFVDGLRFPTDVKVWRDGLLVCDAPDILFVRDTDGDGTAEQVDKWYSGFEVRNAQARVNSLRWGIDNWLYGSCGLFGGEITSRQTGETVNVTSRDFRLQPDRGAIEPVSGRTQQGRCRNDWGDWFGCSNGTLLRHYADEERYAGRNPFVAPSSPQGLAAGADVHRLFPPENIVRFALTGATGKATSACGLGVLRDPRWGEEYYGSAFTCEPVNQLVHRIKLAPEGLGYRGSRGKGEAESEFLTSTDQWFRPVQARTGPDGALWVVDMYRFVIEHSRWIPQATLQKLDIYAGQRRGRIYRIIPRRLLKESGAERWDVDSSATTELVSLLESPNGPLRDLAHQALVWRDARDAIQPLQKLAAQSNRPLAKIHALGVLSALDGLDEASLLAALQDEHDEVVRHAIRFAEPMLDDSRRLRETVEKLADHDNERVRRQVAWSLGETKQTDVVGALAELASDESNPHIRSSVLTSARAANAKPLLEHYLDLPKAAQRPDILRSLATTAIRLGERDEIGDTLLALTVSTARHDDAGMATLAAALDAADARIGDAGFEADPQLQRRVQSLHQQALKSLNPSAVALLGRDRGRVTRALLEAGAGPVVSTEQAVAAIGELLSARKPVSTQQTAVAALARIRDDEAAAVLVDRLSAVGAKPRDAILDALLARDAWTAILLKAIDSGKVHSGILDASRRSKLLSHNDQAVRAAAERLLQSERSPSRAAVVEQYQSALQRTGDVDRGREVFRKRCSSCHKLEGHGHVVGPELQALTNRDPKWLLTTILDPNRDVDARYVSWSAVTLDGRVASGMIVEETAAAVKLRESGGKEHVILRQDLEEFRSSTKSVMPEGLEKDITPQDMSDVIAYVTATIGAARRPADTSLPRYSSQIAPFLLDDSQPLARRQQAIDARPGMGPAVINLLTSDLTVADKDEEYRRMPWIWRVALAVGKRNDGGEIRDTLDISLPKGGEPLQDWQAVVIGGGIINGLTQAGHWPGRRIDAILAGAPSLASRWPRMLKLSAAMADDAQVKLGTRYDALRIIALDEPSTAIAHLQKYLTADADRQLQMGAVSGLADIESSSIIDPLIDSLSFVKGRNRSLAIEGLLRTPARFAGLQQALTDDPQLLTTADLDPLLKHEDQAVAERAVNIRKAIN